MDPFTDASVEQARCILEQIIPFAPPDNALWKTAECLAFQGEKTPPPVLDLGCGDGKFASVLFGHPLEVGLDIRSARVQEAARSGSYRLALQGDARRLPFADHSFGTVFSACAVEHIPEVNDVLQEVARVLRPGGRFLFSVPSHLFGRYLYFTRSLHRAGLPRLGRAYTRWVNWLLAMRHFHSPTAWGRMLKRAGLNLVRARYILPRPSIEFWDRSLIWGNLFFLPVRLLYRTPLRRFLVRRLADLLLPYCKIDVKAGGGLVLVAEKPR